jgi:Retroviral aspartyl protease
MEKEYVTRNSKINSVEENSEENKNSFNYISESKNPFYKRISINNGKRHPGLIDTGADVSLINVENIPTDTKIAKSNDTIYNRKPTKNHR